MPARLESRTSFRGTSVARYQFDNGLELLYLADHRAPIISYQTWFAVGSRDETPGKTGIAHFFEHLMFSGTASRPAGEYDRIVEGCGGDSNAATWVDWTYYRLSMPARDLPLAVTLEADRMENLILSEEIVESERQVVLNERLESVDEDVDGFLAEKLFESAYPPSHPYHWPTIGWRDDIANLGIDDLAHFYRHHYSPRNAFVVVVGDCDEARLVAEIERGYQSIDAPPKPERAEPEPAAPPGGTERRFAKPVAAERALFGYLGPAQGTREWAAADLLATLVAGSPSAPLTRTLVTEKQTATSVSAGMTPFGYQGLFEVSVSSTREGDAKGALEDFESIVDDLRRNVDPTELARAKRCMLTDFWTDLVSQDGKAEALGHYEMVTGDYQNLLNYPDIIDSLTAEDVDQAVTSLLSSDNRAVVIAEPDA